MIRCITIFALILSLCSTTLSQTPEDVFNRANELFRVGKFQEAIKEYESIVKQNTVSAEIYFNLGNAYYRTEQLAKAILSYERAAKLKPNDPDIEHNLKLVYMKTIDRIEPVPEMFIIQWMRAIGAILSPQTAKLIFIIAWILMFCSLAVMYLVLKAEIVHILRPVVFISFIVVVLSALMMGIQSFRDTTEDKAIVTGHTVTAKSSPDPKSVDAFVIHEGVKVKLADEVGNWVKIALADGKVGWIQSADCEKI